MILRVVVKTFLDRYGVHPVLNICYVITPLPPCGEIGIVIIDNCEHMRRRQKLIGTVSDIETRNDLSSRTAQQDRK